jgi:hypothetical protein
VKTHLVAFLTAVVLGVGAGPLLHGVEIARSGDKPSASEGNTPIDGQFVITRGDDSVGQAITIHWQLGTPLKPATATTDFILLNASDNDITGVSGTVVIPAGQASTTITVRPQADTSLEGAEDVTIELLDDPNVPATYIVGPDQSSTITIADDDVTISLSVPNNSIAYEDYTPDAGVIGDPDRNRRAAFRATITPVPTFSTYVGVAIAPGGAPGLATLNTDYDVVYKIGGGSLGSGINYTVRPRFAYQAGVTQMVVDGGSAPIMPNATFTIAGDVTVYTTSGGLAGTSGTLAFSPALTAAVADNTTLTVTPPAPASGFTVNQPTNPVAGATQVDVAGGNGAIPAGARIQFDNHATIYTVFSSTVLSGSGRLTLTSGLSQSVPDTTPLTVTYAAATGFAVNQANSEPIDTKTLVVAGGLGDFAVGDVFRIDTQTTPQYVITAWTPGAPGTGTITFTAFTGTAGPTGGLAQAISGTPAVVTHFPAVYSGVGNNEIRVLVPGTATKVEYGIVPDSDSLAEGLETVTMAMVTSTDYVVSGTRNLRISDDDVIVAFDPTQCRNATVGGTDGSFRIVLTSAFPQDVTIAYAISGTADNSGSPTDPLTGDLDPIATSVTIPANTTSATIPIHGRVGSGSGSKTLTLTLLPSDEYRLVTTPGATQNSSATITINHPLGTVSVVGKSGATVAREKLVSPVPATFTVSVVPAPTSDLTVAYTIGGTASSGLDYIALSGNLTIPATATSAEISIMPSDDAIPDAGETVIVTLQTGLYYLVSGTANSATIAIADDEPELSISRTADITEGETDKTVFTITAAAAVPRNTVVDLSWSGTSVAGDRIVPTSVTILAGQTSAVVAITATNDGTVEGGETIIATIADRPAVYTRVTSTATATISDFLPTFTLTVDRDGVEGSATTGRFRITSSAVPAQPITVAYTVSSSSTATAGAAAGTGIDYKTLPLTVDVTTTDTFIEVQVFDDSIYDPFETVIITLTDQTPPAFAHAGTTPLTATMRIQDALVGVTSVTSSSPNGAYTVGDTIAIAVTFTEAVTVSGAPTLQLETGSSDAVATFVGRSPPDTLNFSYTVRATDVNADLDYHSSAALSLNGGSITGGTPAADARLTLPVPGAVGSLSAAKSLTVDGGSTDGKPAPGAVDGASSGGGCGLGSGVAALVLYMLAGFALSVRRKRP